MIRLLALLALLWLIAAAAAPAPALSSEQPMLLVAARPIARGAIISAADVALAPAHGLVLDALSDSAQAIGRTAKHAIAPGVYLRGDALLTPPAVRRGDPVTLRIERPGFSVEAAGAAVADGVQGASVAAINSSTGKRLRGTVRSDGIIFVEGLKAAQGSRHSENVNRPEGPQG